MGRNWKGGAAARNKNEKKEKEAYGRVMKFINLLMNEEGIIHDGRAGVEYSLEQAKELIERGWAETQDKRLLRELEKNK